ncbi:SGNH/GDSL hydrolase family protein [Georgenia deserti]|uniref:SGNH/GDSL hydrolase family protein n=1 Tax=Georgenia deserti TaxID=2093781 RepID=A0ABW4L316_9MICO
MSQPGTWHRYVALGDSMTEGLWDLPDGAERTRGWADLLAHHLAARSRPEPLEYANLAVRGRLLGQIVETQLPQALAMRPDLVSLVGGGNDLLRPGADPDALARLLEGAVASARGEGADVLLATGVDPALGLLRAIRGKVAIFNGHLWSIARRHGAFVMDLWGMRSLRDRRMWAEDRVHMTAAGHERVAQAALAGLDLAPDTPNWDDPLEPLPRPARAEWLRGELTWARTHMGPWVGRRLRRTSSGSRIQPKRPEPEVVRV